MTRWLSLANSILSLYLWYSFVNVSFESKRYCFGRLWVQGKPSSTSQDFASTLIVSRLLSWSAWAGMCGWRMWRVSIPSCRTLHNRLIFEPLMGRMARISRFENPLWIKFMMIPFDCYHSALTQFVSIDTQSARILLTASWPILVMTRSNVFACRFANGQHCHWITIWWEPLTPPDRCDTCLAFNVDNFDAMDLADADNEVVAVDDEDVMTIDDEEVFYVSSS